ncbi:hypothetical protein DFJ77DRAFT_473233 [Powellomyces hirtus]|nr:hypothetical protein DFJ77DRAFT_473233 [Powellomyces hirtus]
MLSPQRTLLPTAGRLTSLSSCFLLLALYLALLFAQTTLADAAAALPRPQLSSANPSSTNPSSNKDKKETKFCDSLKPQCLAKSGQSVNATCRATAVELVCHEPATKDKNDYCFKCVCGSEQIMSSIKCGTMASVNIPTTTLRPQPTPRPKRISNKPHDNDMGGAGSIVPLPPSTPGEAIPVRNPDQDKIRSIGGGVGGTLGGVLLVVSATTFFIARKRKRFGKAPPVKTSEMPLVAVDEFRADDYKRKEPPPPSSPPSPDASTVYVDISESSMPALAMLARSDSMTRIKAQGDHKIWPAFHHSNPFAQGLSPTSSFPPPLVAFPPPPSQSGPPPLTTPSHPNGPPHNDEDEQDLSALDSADPLYLEHLRERQEMRQHWQQRASSPEPTESILSVVPISSPTLPASPLARTRLANDFSTPLFPSPLRTSSTVSAATTESNDSSSSMNTHRVLSSHFPQRDDEVAVHPGDAVIVWRVWEDGWCKGTVVRGGGKHNDHHATEGIFPVRCVRNAEDVDECGTLCGWEGARSDSLLP